MLDAEISSAKFNIEQRLRDNDEQLKSYFATIKSQKEQFAKEKALMQKENQDKLNESNSIWESFRSDLNELELKKQQTFLQAQRLQKKMELSDPKLAGFFKHLLVDGLESKVNMQDPVLPDVPSENVSKSEKQEALIQVTNKLSHFAYENEDRPFESQGLKSAPKIKKVESIRLVEPVEKIISPVSIKPYEPPSTFQNLKFESFADQNAKVVAKLPQNNETKVNTPVVQQVLPKSTSIMNPDKGIDSPQTIRQEASFESEKKKTPFDSYTSPFKKPIEEVHLTEKSTGQKPNQFSERLNSVNTQPQITVQKQAPPLQIGEKSPAFPKNEVSQSSNKEWDWSSKKQSQAPSNKIPVKGNETSGFSSFQSVEKPQPKASNFGMPPVIQASKKKQESFHSDEFDDLF